MRNRTLKIGVITLATLVLGGALAPRAALAQDHGNGHDHGLHRGQQRDGRQDRREDRRQDRRQDRREDRREDRRDDRHGPRLGAVITVMPRDHERVVVRGAPYFVRDGVFYRHGRHGYEVVAAPIGAVVRARPAYAVAVRVGRGSYWYFHGAFYRWDGWRRVYVVVAPPPGAEVSYLPDGYHERDEGGTAVYVVGGVRYRPVVRSGITVFVVIH